MMVTKTRTMRDCSSTPRLDGVIGESKNNGTMEDEQHAVLVGVDDDNSKKTSCVSVLSDVSSSTVVSSDDSDLFEEEGEEVNSTESSSSPSSGSSPTTAATGYLQDMSSLLQELPFKRGLSKHYNGRSQSFTSLSNVRCLEDLAKPENPYNKKLKSCRSYGGLMLESRHGSSSSSRFVSSKKTTTRGGSCSSLCVRRNTSTGFLGSNRPPPPVPPHRSSSRSNFTTQTPLFALGV